MRRTPFAVALLAAACSPPAGGPPSPSPVPPGASPITSEALRRDLVIFASDSFRGRETGTPGELRGARFLVERLSDAAGIEPAGDSGFYQLVPLVRRAFGPATRIAVARPGGETRIAIGASALPLLTLGPGAPSPRLRARGDLVFAGYGVSIPELGRDDLTGLDVAGKAVVIVNGAPAGVDSARRAMLQSQAMIGERIGQLVARGPAAIIIMLTGEFGEEFEENVAQLLTTITPPSPTPEVPDSLRQLPMIILGIPAPGSPLLPAGWPEDDRPQVLEGRTFDARVDVERQDITGYNVVAVVRGGDPAYNESYVAFGSHLDHIGIQPPVNGDSIGNGADDDGSGSVTQLAVAKAIAAAPDRPRRSVLFVWHSAEEKGLLGSSWFTAHPTVPLDSIVAQINADMIGRNSPDSLYIVGPEAAPEGQSMVLGTIVDSVNAALATPFAFNREWDSATHPERIYFRSDHYNYAVRGIPVVFFTSGLHDDYHKVSDEVGKIDYDKMARVGALLYDIGIALGNRRTRPR